jgi:hypothetical protein
MTRDHSAHALPIFSTPSKHPTRSNARNSIPFMPLLHTSLYTPGGGMHPRASSATHYPLFPTHGSPQNFYPPACDLRHNPAAQGHVSAALNQQAHSSSQTGRIQ